MRLDKQKAIDYTMVYLLVAFTGIDFFARTGVEFMIPVIAWIGVIFYIRKKLIDKFFVYFFLFFLVVQLLQSVKFYSLPLGTIFGVQFRILFAYLVLRNLEEKFIDYYINIMYYSAILSFFFYIPSYVPGFERFLVSTITPLFKSPFIDYESHYSVMPSLIVYTVNTKGEGTDSILRNSGPFWEPGAFAGFLVIALLFIVIKEKSMFSKKGNILMLALLSTFSTTGIIVIAVIIISYIMAHRSIVLKLMIVPLLLLVSYVAYNSLDFLGKKISNNMAVDDATYNNRFKSAYIDYMDALDNPLLGLGRAPETRFKGIKDPVLNHRNNGVSDYLASYGFVVFLVYFVLIYYSYRKLCLHYGFNPNFALYCITIMILIGFTETYFSRPYFYILTMLFLVYNGTSLQNNLNIKTKV
jgi:hypothetical protein